MHHVLVILGILAAALGLASALDAATQMQVIQAAMLALIGSVLIVGGAIVWAVDRLRREAAQTGMIMDW